MKRLHVILCSRILLILPDARRTYNIFTHCVPDYYITARFGKYFYLFTV